MRFVVVVLPFVPVTNTVCAGTPTYERKSGQRRSATTPGSWPPVVLDARPSARTRSPWTPTGQRGTARAWTSGTPFLYSTARRVARGEGAVPQRGARSVCEVLGYGIPSHAEQFPRSQQKGLITRPSSSGRMGWLGTCSNQPLFQSVGGPQAAWRLGIGWLFSRRRWPAEPKLRETNGFLAPPKVARGCMPAKPQVARLPFSRLTRPPPHKPLVSLTLGTRSKKGLVGTRPQPTHRRKKGLVGTRPQTTH